MDIEHLVHKLDNFFDDKKAQEERKQDADDADLPQFRRYLFGPFKYIRGDLGKEIRRKGIHAFKGDIGVAQEVSKHESKEG